MSVRPYLPSGQFSLITLSVFLSAGLVYGAQLVTQQSPSSLSSVSQSDAAAAAAAHANWEATLSNIQDQVGATLPTAPDPDTVDALRKNAQTSNLTDSMARSLLINVTDARSQGLGDDLPTQNQLVNAALAQIQQTTLPSTTYTTNDLTVVPDSEATMHTYSNMLIVALQSYPDASVGKAIQILGDKINGQSDELSQLTSVGKAYTALAKALLKIPVPQSVASYHVAIINEYMHMADACPNMQTLASDPLRSLAGLQSFSNSSTNIQSLFINIARVIDKDGILFSKDEPGASWAALLSAQ